MDVLSLLIAAVLGLGSAGAATTSAPGSTDSGTATSSESPSDTTEARSHIIDLG